jgi:hypothetical protein
MHVMTFDAAMKLGRWLPIRDCPGRFVLRAVSPKLSVTDLLGNDAKVLSFRPPMARDCVLLVRLKEGGIISYSRPDGTYLHTLNTEEGLRRKLEQLGIRLDESDGAWSDSLRR